MKLVRYSQNGQPPRLGALLGTDRVMDLEASAEAYLASRGVVRAAAIANALFPHHSTRGFLEGGSASQEVLSAMTEAGKKGTYQLVTHALSSARLHAPIADPGKFICIGLNYRDHAEETGNPIPKEPPIFGKWAPSIVGPGEPILRPRGCTQLDWEVELGVVIGRTARHDPQPQVARGRSARADPLQPAGRIVARDEPGGSRPLRRVRVSDLQCDGRHLNSPANRCTTSRNTSPGEAFAASPV